MGNPRYKALQITGERDRTLKQDVESFSPVDTFGKRVFNKKVMKEMLPTDVYKNIIAAIDGKEKIKDEYADLIALAMKEWAINQGATHFCHWFQPLTGSTAEKHDAFIEWNSPEDAVEKFSGKQLIQGEPDASSFPSGGLRTTFEARGYTGWDPSSPVFVWKAGDGITLCIPSVFFSWTGDVLDCKIPLLRSDKKINEATLRLLKLTGIKAGLVYSTLGMEQEYFVIDRALRNLRPDLVLIGRTVVGAPSPKGQELQDHYFGSVKDRILSYMHDFEVAALELGIPLKTRHNEVAPSQYEVTPAFEKASVAIDHNILLMELMRQIAHKHGLSCLLHEKPFAGLNGSGKHCNWSLSTDTGINLLHPTDTPENNLHFLILLTAILSAVHRHSALLRTSVGSANNDYRLGGHEAPPAIISVYLGDELEKLLNNIETTGASKSSEGKPKYDFGLHVIPELTQDNTDRNRTSPFAFTGNKFEFRAVGSSMTGAFPTTVLNLIVAESLNEILDEIEPELKKEPAKSDADLISRILPILKKYITASKNIRFSGDNYSEAWVKEAERRGLPNYKKSIYAFDALTTPQTEKLFKGVLTKLELDSRYQIMAEAYANTHNIEANLILDLFKTYVLPTTVDYQTQLSESIHSLLKVNEKATVSNQKKLLQQISEMIEKSLTLCHELEGLRVEAEKESDQKTRAEAHCEKVAPKCKELRTVIDALEQIMPDAKWPLPKYRELLFMV